MKIETLKMLRDWIDEPFRLTRAQLLTALDAEIAEAEREAELKSMTVEERNRRERNR